MPEDCQCRIIYTEMLADLFAQFDSGIAGLMR